MQPSDGIIHGRDVLIFFGNMLNEYDSTLESIELGKRTFRPNITPHNILRIHVTGTLSQ